MSAVEHCLGPLSQIPNGEGRLFHLPGHGAGSAGPAGSTAVAVFHLRSGAVHATQAACPHRNGPLADGLIGGTTLICPLHGRKYDLTTGEELSGGCGVATYPVRVTDSGQIMIRGAPDATAPAPRVREE